MSKNGLNPTTSSDFTTICVSLTHIYHSWHFSLPANHRWTISKGSIIFLNAKYTSNWCIHFHRQSKTNVVHWWISCVCSDDIIVAALMSFMFLTNSHNLSSKKPCYFLFFSSCLSRTMDRKVTATLPLRFLVVLIHLARLPKLSENMPRHRQNACRVWTEGSIFIHLPI